MISESQLVLFMLVLARVSAFIAFFPLFSRRQLPNLVKLGLATALSFFWWFEAESSSVIVQSSLDQWGTWSIVLLTIKEVLIGIVLSIVLGLLFWPAKIAGAYIGQEMGLSLASISDPGSEDSATVVGRIFEAFSVLIFFGNDPHHFIVLVLHESFHRLFGQIGLLQLPTEHLVHNLARMDEYGLLVIAPLLTVLMLVTLLLIFLNRAAPTLNLFSVGMTLRICLGLCGLFLFCPVILPAIESYYHKVQGDISELLRFLT